MTFYVKTDEPTFTRDLKAELEKYGMRESLKLPVGILFMAGKDARHRELFNMKQSTFTNIAIKIPITSKVELHKLLKGHEFIKDFDVIDDDVIPPFRKLRILKPVDGYRGVGITLVKTVDDVRSWLNTHTSKEWLLQDYILNPALKDGHKFHLRVPIIMVMNRVYVSIRSPYYLAKELYKKDDWLNANIHDTHYNPNFNYVYPDDLPDTWKRSKDIYSMFKTVFAGITLRPDWNSKHSFKLFGADVMFDKRTPILIEVNDQIGLKKMEFVIPGLVAILLGKEQTDFVRLL